MSKRTVATKENFESHRIIEFDMSRKLKLHKDWVRIIKAEQAVKIQ